MDKPYERSCIDKTEPLDYFRSPVKTRPSCFPNYSSFKVKSSFPGSKTKISRSKFLRNSFSRRLYFCFSTISSFVTSEIQWGDKCYIVGEKGVSVLKKASCEKKDKIVIEDCNVKKDDENNIFNLLDFQNINLNNTFRKINNLFYEMEEDTYFYQHINVPNQSESKSSLVIQSSLCLILKISKLFTNEEMCKIIINMFIGVNMIEIINNNNLNYNNGLNDNEINYIDNKMSENSHKRCNHNNNDSYYFVKLYFQSYEKYINAKMILSEIEDIFTSLSDFNSKVKTDHILL
jgi:hypothetical protein